MKWAKLRKMLDGTFLNRICSLDLSQVTAAQAERFRSLLQCAAFSDGGLHDKCPAAAPLAVWCNAVGRQLAQTHPGRAKLSPSENSPEASHQAGQARRTKVNSRPAPAHA